MHVGLTFALMITVWWFVQINDSLADKNESLKELVSTLELKIKEPHMCPPPPLCLPKIIEGPEREVVVSHCDDDCPSCYNPE